MTGCRPCEVEMQKLKIKIQNDRLKLKKQSRGWP